MNGLYACNPSKACSISACSEGLFLLCYAPCSICSDEWVVCVLRTAEFEQKLVRQIENDLVPASQAQRWLMLVNLRIAPWPDEFTFQCPVTA
jgi:hypothetical protein